MPNILYDVSEKYSTSKPIYNNLVYNINKHKDEKNVIIICHNADKIKLKNIISNDFGENVYISTWKNLQNQIDDFERENTLILAVEPPYIGDEIFVDKVEKIKFIMNSGSLNFVKELISEMKIGFSYHPIYFSRSKLKAPVLLLKMEEHLEMERIEFVKKEVSIDLTDDLKSWCKNEIIHPTEIKLHEKKEREIIDTYDRTIVNDENQEVVYAIEKNKKSCMFFPKHTSLHIVGHGKQPLIAKDLIGEYTDNPLKISISKQGISTKVHLADWLINDFDVGEIRREIYVWDSFYELILDSIFWIECLRNEAESLQSDIELAKLISNSQTTARDTDYILNWWTSTEGIIKTPDGDKIFIPSIERPKSRSDINIIADVINDSALKKSADRIWKAVVEVQSIRNRFLNAFQKIAIEREKLKRKAGSKAEEKFIEILNNQNMPDFFMDLFSDFDVFEAVLVDKTILADRFPLFKRIDINEIKSLDINIEIN